MKRRGTEGVVEDPRVVAVVVAYNRRQLLSEVLTALQSQTRPVDDIVVVDNASTDGSADVARSSAPGATLIRLTRNTGGAGGFAVGMAAALQRHEPDWIWVMDDDTVPTESALAEMVNAIDRYPGPDLVAVGSRVVWTDGSDHPMNTPRPNPFAKSEEKEFAAVVQAQPVRSLSFVSSMYRADVVRRLGLPIVDYFLWNDDFEFSSRILREGRGLSVPSSVVVHKTKALASTDADPGPRFRLEVRNKVWLFRASAALRPGEKLVYAGASVRRWIVTFLRSADRATLRDGLVTGLREGFSARPRPNSAALREAGVPDDVLAAVDGRAA
ncbi:glycosyltransferase family 2 protein [Mycetocola zhujimingii]|uniref:glycosyltransferase family 2 protein n=1 Tax=Mycetocola zhujimingii TaxID=2079792 RepID=UPI000D3DC233|nr:glycosyltransferase family 2 protein [Mycetocola zhujimingii]AWB87887.1 glycosyl transferase [Mycetocola zhujimingii]